MFSDKRSKLKWSVHSIFRMESSMNHDKIILFYNMWKGEKPFNMIGSLKQL